MSVEKIKAEVSESEAGLRIDKWISDKDFGLTRSAAAKLITEGNIYVNGKQPCKKL